VKIAIILVMIPLAIVFLCIGHLIYEDKINFNNDGIVYCRGGIVKEAKDSDKDNANIRKLGGVTLIFCSICMILLPIFMF